MRGWEVEKGRGECGERGWQAIGRHGAHSGKPGVEVRGGRGGEERRPSVASSNNNINNYNDQKRHPQLQLSTTRSAASNGMQRNSFFHLTQPDPTAYGMHLVLALQVQQSMLPLKNTIARRA